MEIFLASYRRGRANLVAVEATEKPKTWQLLIPGVMGQRIILGSHIFVGARVAKQGDPDCTLFLSEDEARAWLVAQNQKYVADLLFDVRAAQKQVATLRPRQAYPDGRPLFRIDYARQTDELHMACDDHAAEAMLLEEYAFFLDGFDITIGTTTENVIHAAAALIAEGKMEWSAVRVIYQGEEIRFDPFGNLDTKPDDLGNAETDFMFRRLIAAMGNR